MDEVFYLLEGQATFLLQDQIVTAGQGAFVFIPRGTVHGFRIDRPTARFLNLYTPAVFERMLTLLGHKAVQHTLPPADLAAASTVPARLVALFQEIGMRGIAVPDPSKT